jgi:PPK2 family polyphosphate:nucleotide phosphotransferase
MSRKHSGGDTKRGAALGDLLRAPAGPVDLAALDTRATPGVTGGKDAALERLPVLGARLADLQEKLYAQARAGGSRRRVLLVLQGMDTSGKGGTVRHVAARMDPNGVRVTAFGRPTKEELEHDFLWRVRRRLPEPGQVAIFDRSHYEDVLAVRVRGLVPRGVWARRYMTINRFEQRLVEDGCVIVKCLLHISRDEQRDRLLARLDDPAKHWKYDPSDVEDRALWPAYQEAYEAVLERCGTSAAPWYIVPADRKWYRDHAITSLLIETLETLDLDWPPGDFDAPSERTRILNT